MRNALGGKPASMGLSAQTVRIAGALIALFAFSALVLAADVQKAQAATPVGTVKITVVNVDGSPPSNVKLTIKKQGASSRSGSVTATGTKITFSATPGTYVITKSSSKYKTWGGDCNANGEVVIIADTQANCTLSNAVPTPPPPPPPSDEGGSMPSRTDIRTR